MFIISYVYNWGKFPLCVHRQSLWDTEAAQTARSVVNNCCQRWADFPSFWVCWQYHGIGATSIVWWQKTAQSVKRWNQLGQGRQQGNGARQLASLSSSLRHCSWHDAFNVGGYWSQESVDKVGGELSLKLRVSGKNWQHVDGWNLLSDGCMTCSDPVTLLF